MKRTISLLLILCLLCTMSASIAFAAPQPKINILLNGVAVQFNNDTGYPYIDENNRTMVPLRATMEAAGFAVGYDSKSRTAIVVTEHNRIEVPIGTNIVYRNNTTIKNDTSSVVKNGRTYLPIRAVLEAAGFTVEWDSKTKSVDAYTYEYNSDDFVPYHTSSLSTLVTNVLNGDVVYINGQYYTTPEYVKMLSTPKVHYLGNDLNTAILPGFDRYALANLDTKKLLQESLDSAEWIQESDLTSYNSELSFELEPYDGGAAYAFIHASPLSGSVHDKYILKSLSDDIAEKDELDGVYDGIHIRKKGGVWYFKLEDLKKHNII